MNRVTLCTVLSVAAILGLSCSNNINFSGDEEKVEKLTIQSYNYPPGTMNISEIKLERNITVEDSINYYLMSSNDIVQAHEETLKKLNGWLDLKKSKEYSDWDVDSQIENLTAELDRFANAFDGKINDESWDYEYTYRNLYRLRQMDRNKVLGKVYSITYTLKTSKPIKEIRSFNADITKSLATYSDIEAVKKPAQGDLEKIHFKRYDEISKEELPEANFIQEGGEIQEFDEEGNPVK